MLNVPLLLVIKKRTQFLGFFLIALLNSLFNKLFVVFVHKLVTYTPSAISIALCHDIAYLNIF